MCKDHARRRLRRAAMEWLEPRTLLSTYLVTTNADSGAGSLRQAMTDSNANTAGAPNEIDFAIGSGAQTRNQVRQAFIATPEFGTRVQAVIQQGCMQ